MAWERSGAASRIRLEVTVARILVVAYDPNSLDLAGLALEDGGHEVVLCHRPKEALDAACALRGHAAVLDVPSRAPACPQGRGPRRERRRAPVAT